jgi:hypothetical protein
MTHEDSIILIVYENSHKTVSRSKNNQHAALFWADERKQRVKSGCTKAVEN